MCPQAGCCPLFFCTESSPDLLYSVRSRPCSVAFRACFLFSAISWLCCRRRGPGGLYRPPCSSARQKHMCRGLDFGCCRYPKGTRNPARVFLVNWQWPLANSTGATKPVPGIYFCLRWPELLYHLHPKNPSCNIMFPATWVELGCRERHMGAGGASEP